MRWEELARVYERRPDGNNPSVIVRFGKERFDGLLRFLLDDLVRREKMTQSDRPKEGDFYLVGVGGIDVKTLWNPRDTLSSKYTLTYFPRVRADAEAYARAFFSGEAVQLAKVVSEDVCGLV